MNHAFSPSFDTLTVKGDGFFVRDDVSENHAAADCVALRISPNWDIEWATACRQPKDSRNK